MPISVMKRIHLKMGIIMMVSLNQLVDSLAAVMGMVEAMAIMAMAVTLAAVMVMVVTLAAVMVMVEAMAMTEEILPKHKSKTRSLVLPSLELVVAVLLEVQQHPIMPVVELLRVLWHAKQPVELPSPTTMPEQRQSGQGTLIIIRPLMT